MNALQELNKLRAAAKLAGIVGYNKMKLADLRELGLSIEETPKPKADDPFDEIDPETEGDHLTDESVKGKATEIKVTREAWLLSAVDSLAPLFRAQGAKVPHLSVSVGFPSTNARKRIGECWHGADNEHPQLFISPVLDRATEVLGVLVHEMVHACLGAGHGHGKEFGALARALGLTGKMTATEPDASLLVILEDVVREIGDYPHVKLTLSTNTKKQTTRLLKVWCPDCQGMPIRVTKKYADNLPYCGSGCTTKVASEVETDDDGYSTAWIDMPTRMVFADGGEEETEDIEENKSNHPWTKPSVKKTEESKVMDEIGE